MDSESAGEIRQRGSETPILLLTAVGKPADIIAGLNMGADDYVTSPLNMRELMTRIEVLFQRPRNVRRKAVDVYEFGSIRVDVPAAETTREDNVVNLFAREFRLLRYFLEHPGVTFSREDLLLAVWGPSQQRPTRTVDMHVASLRRKLEDQPRQPKHFLTVHRLGYKFRP
jgi:two-component system alkaline phosphatase synthesis response regulator PhoP